jgi:hypothetical protein
MQAIEDDMTLRANSESDRAARALVTDAEPWNDSLDATPVFGIRATVEVSEV